MPGLLALALTAGVSSTSAESALGAAAAPGVVAASQPSTSDPVSQAISAAAAMDTPVVVEGFVTESTRLLANPDTTLTMEISNEPVRARRGGAWVDVNTALAFLPDGSVAPKVTTADMKFSGGGSSALVSYQSGAARLTLTAPTTLPRPRLVKNRAIYSEVYPGVDFVLTADADSYRQTLVVKSPTAAADPRVRQLRFPMSVQGVSLGASQGGGFTAVDSVGVTAFEAAQPLMWDAGEAGATASAAAVTTPSSSPTSTPAPDPLIVQPGDSSLVAPVPVTVSATELTLAPNIADLGAAPTYPVYIDPTVAPSRTGWAMVSSLYPTTKYWRFGGDEGMGYYSGTRGTMVKRLFYMFATGGLAGADIRRARFTAFETHANSCTPSEVGAYRTSDISPSTTWNSQPSWSATANSVKNVAYGRLNCSPGGHDVEFDVTESLQYSTSRRLPNTTIGLRAINEKHSSGWKRFTGGAVLSIDFNRPPSTPSSASMINPSKGCGAAFPASDPPDLRVVPRDADGESVTTEFEITGGGLTTPVKLAAVSRANYWATVGIPKNTDGTFLRGPGTYSWRARTKDPAGYGPYTAACTFILDNTQPSVPSLVITPTSSGTGVDNEYTAGSVLTLILGPGATDPTKIHYYEWSLNNTATTNRYVPGAAPPQVVLTGPMRSIIRARSVTHAGLGSPLVEQSVTVLWNGVQEKNHWKLDERSGGLGADTPTSPPSTTRSAMRISGAASFLPATDGGVRFPENPNDGAVRCNAAQGSPYGASTLTQLVDVNRNWSLTGWVRPGAATGKRVVLEEDGASEPPFEVSVQEVAGVGWDGQPTTRRVFALTVDNPSGSNPVLLAPDFTAVPGQWYGLGVTYDATARTYTLFVQPKGFLGRAVTSTVSFAPPTVLGYLRLCRSWIGDVDDVINIPDLASQRQLAARLGGTT